MLASMQHASCYVLAVIGAAAAVADIGKALARQCSLQYSMNGTVQQAKYAND